MKNTVLTYDKKADAMYIALGKILPGSVKKTISLNEDLLVDLDSEKKIVGIEILNASKNLSKTSIKTAEAIA